MRDQVAAHFANPPAPQAPARNPPLDTYNSHRKVRRPKLGDRKVYRPVRRHTLSRIDEAPPARPRSRSLQHSTDFSSTRPILRSRSNISADTSRSVPVCNQSHELGAQLESASPPYDEPKPASDSSGERASMCDLPIMVPVDPATGAYIAYPDIFRHNGCRLNPQRWRRNKSKHNLYLAFMY